MSDHLMIRARDLLQGLPGQYSVVRCDNCGLMRTNPRPAEGTIGFYYPNEYGPYNGTKIAADSSKDEPSERRKLLIRRILSLDGRRVPDIKPGNLLEIGCASGSFLSRMKRDGWTVRGIEFSKHAAENARSAGLDVYTGTIASAPDPVARYDLVVGWMVLEHLHEPVSVLRRLNGWVRPNAWLALSVPNASSWSLSLFKSYLHALQLPNHLFHFTPRKLKLILATSGWDMKAIHYQQNLTTPIASLGYWLADKNVCSDLAGALIEFPSKGSKWGYRAVRPLAMFESLIGQSSRVTVWAQPKVSERSTGNTSR